MRKILTPTLLLTIGLISVTLFLLFSAFALGLIPDEDKSALRQRAAVAQIAAVQAAAFLDRQDRAGLQAAIDGVVSAEGEVSWAKVSAPSGQTIAQAGRAPRWAASRGAGVRPDEISISVPLVGLAPVELSLGFKPLGREANILGLTASMIEFVVFMTLAGFASFYLLLRRGLRELDPSRTVPERVKAAFDTLAEGLLITDERGYVLLANAAFTRSIYAGAPSLIGQDVSALPWVRSADRPVGEPFPWTAAMRDKKPVVGVQMSIQNGDNETKQLSINATRISGSRGELRGVIITFDDVTILEKANYDLNKSLEQLKKLQADIEKKNEQLKILASNDPLTNCLNRRTFFSRLEEETSDPAAGPPTVSFLMVDGDHFKSINDRFGHAVGDRVLIGLVEIMHRLSSEGALVGRYGGEEFCLALVGRPKAEAEDLAERIRSAVAVERTWLPEGQRVTVSIGVSFSADRSLPIADLVQRADEALYAAKLEGRNRVVSWERMRASPQMLAS